MDNNKISQSVIECETLKTFDFCILLPKIICCKKDSNEFSQSLRKNQISQSIMSELAAKLLLGYFQVYSNSGRFSDVSWVNLSIRSYNFAVS